MNLLQNGAGDFVAVQSFLGIFWLSSISSLGYSVYDSSKTSLLTKCLGCFLVSFGLFLTLIRILFSDLPSIIGKQKFLEKNNNAKQKGKKCSKNVKTRINSISLKIE